MIPQKRTPLIVARKTDLTGKARAIAPKYKGLWGAVRVSGGLAIPVAKGDKIHTIGEPLTVTEKDLDLGFIAFGPYYVSIIGRDSEILAKEVMKYSLRRAYALCEQKKTKEAIKALDMALWAYNRMGPDRKHYEQELEYWRKQCTDQ
jgi:hypothetical protein